MRHHVHYRPGRSGGSVYAGGSSFMERVSEAVASGMGSVAFHREELAQSQSDLLQRNTVLTEQIHTLIEKMNILTEQVHAATCERPSVTR